MESISCINIKKINSRSYSSHVSVLKSLEAQYILS